MRLCLEAREYRIALPVLDNDIFHFPLPSDRGAVHVNPRHLCAHHDSRSTFLTVASGLSEKLDHQDHLQYFLLGAMIYIGMKNWVRALLFLDIVIMSPANNTTSMIQVEAYKKWILVGLLLRGHVSAVSFPFNFLIMIRDLSNASSFNSRGPKILIQQGCIMPLPSPTNCSQESFMMEY